MSAKVVTEANALSRDDLFYCMLGVRAGCHTTSGTSSSAIPALQNPCHMIDSQGSPRLLPSLLSRQASDAYFSAIRSSEMPTQMTVMDSRYHITPQGLVEQGTCCMCSTTQPHPRSLPHDAQRDSARCTRHISDLGSHPPPVRVPERTGIADARPEKTKNSWRLGR